MKVRLTERARLDREQIWQKICIDNGSQAADRIDDRIWHSLGMLARFPLLGTASIRPGIRQRTIPGTPFLALYTVTASGVLIKQILHGAQQHPARTPKL